MPVTGATGVLPLHRRLPAAASPQAATPVSATLAGVANTQPLDLLADVASRMVPTTDSRPLTLQERAFIDFLQCVDPPLGVALAWSYAWDAPDAKGLLDFAQRHRLVEAPSGYVGESGVLTEAATTLLAPQWAQFQRMTPAEVEQARRAATYEAAFIKHLKWCNPPLAVALEQGRIPLDTRQAQKEDFARRYEQAAFDVSLLPPERKHLGVVDTIARERGLIRFDLMRFVPARELMGDFPAGWDDASRRAANLEVIRRVETQRPDFAASRLWKQAVACSGEPLMERLPSRRWAPAEERDTHREEVRMYVTPAGDFTAHVLQLLEPPPPPPPPRKWMAEPWRVLDRATLGKTQSVAVEWYDMCKKGDTGKWRTLTDLANDRGVNPNGAMNFVSANGTWKNRGGWAIEPLTIEVKEEPVEIPGHAYDNQGPILQTPDGEDALLDALQPPQKRLRSDDLGVLARRQKVTEWSLVGTALAASVEHLPAAERRARLNAEKRRLTEEARAWLTLPKEERARRWAATLDVKPVEELGRGVVAARDIGAFELLGTYNGVYLRNDGELAQEQQRHGAHNVKTYLYSTGAASRTVSGFRFGSVLSMVNEGASLPANNVCPIRLGPNLHFYVSLRAIAAGSDVLVDYGADYDRSGWPNHPIEIPEEAGHGEPRIHVVETPPDAPSGTR